MTLSPSLSHCTVLMGAPPYFLLGSGDLGQLGCGDRCSSAEPVPVEALEGAGVVQISLGTAHCTALVAHGRVMTWGHGNGGRLGHGDEDDRLVPCVVRACGYGCDGGGACLGD
jgi:E3 ubiquitin-protein ligase HERC2